MAHYLFTSESVSKGLSTQQILVPKKVYIGDTAELRCTFNSPDLSLKEITRNGTVELIADLAASKDFDITEIKLSTAGVDFYQLSITFVPWKTGEINFQPLSIEGSEITIEFQPVQIVSLVSTESITSGATTFRDAAAPLLLPGTTYKLYGSIAALILTLIILIRIIIKRESLAFYFSTKKLQRKYRQNKKKTIKSLKKLVAKSSTLSATILKFALTSLSQKLLPRKSCRASRRQQADFFLMKSRKPLAKFLLALYEQIISAINMALILRTES